MKTLGVGELKEHIDEILRMVEEEGETIDVTKRGKVIARVVPASEPEKPVKRDTKAFLAELDRLAAEIGSSWKGNIDAVEAVRDVRRDL
ncbi:MAG TPA: type II toxin-antitoxin system Phd/YefM family antitoxin [Ktedonobacteraceae bacterium]